MVNVLYKFDIIIYLTRCRSQHVILNLIMAASQMANE